MANKNTARASAAPENIESVLLEERSFAPPRAFTANAVIKPADAAALR